MRYRHLLSSDTLFFVSDAYDSWSIILDEQCSEKLCGQLIGLRVIDCNLCLKEDDLAYVPLSVDLTRYVKLKSVTSAREQVGR